MPVALTQASCCEWLSPLCATPTIHQLLQAHRYISNQRGIHYCWFVRWDTPSPDSTLLTETIVQLSEVFVERLGRFLQASMNYRIRPGLLIITYSTVNGSWIRGNAHVAIEEDFIRKSRTMFSMKRSLLDKEIEKTII